MLTVPELGEKKKTLVKRTHAISTLKRYASFSCDLFSSFIYSLVCFASDLSYRDRLIKLRLLPLNYWLEYLDLVFFHKCLNNMVDFTFEFDHYFSFVQGRTRRANAARTSLFRDYFFNRIAIMWNGIPEDIKVATTLCSFKRQLKSFYFKRLYNVFDGDNVRPFKIICPKCRRVNILKACSC